MLKLGELLKNKRQEKGLEVSQASESTKIPQRLIQALEKGNYSAFSSEVYLRGLLKNYIKYLDIDEKKAMAVYRREQNLGKEGSLDDSYRPIEEPKAIITPARLVFMVTALIVISIVGFVVVQINKIIQPPRLEITVPVEATAPGDAFKEVEGDTITIAGKVEVGSKLLINGNEVTTNNLQEFRVDNYKLNPGSNEIYIVAQSYYFSKTSEIKLTVLSKVKEEENSDSDQQSGEQSDAATDEDQTSSGEQPVANEPMNIDISVDEQEAWLVVTIDGETKIEQVVSAGTTFTFVAQEEFTIYSPRPQVITLKINDKEYTFSAQGTTKFTMQGGEVVQG